jgi:hypothetical protein
MAVSTSRIAFSDCFDLLEKAINDEKGIRIKFASYDDAFNFRLRIHKARQIDRIDNRGTYDTGHPLYGRSVYDQISCKIRSFNGGAWLKLEKITAREFEIESLSDEPSEPELALAPKLPPPTMFIQNQGREEAHIVLPIRLKRRI